MAVMLCGCAQKPLINNKSETLSVELYNGWGSGETIVLSSEQANELIDLINNTEKYADTKRNKTIGENDFGGIGGLDIQIRIKDSEELKYKIDTSLNYGLVYINQKLYYYQPCCQLFDLLRSYNDTFENTEVMYYSEEELKKTNYLLEVKGDYNFVNEKFEVNTYMFYPDMALSEVMSVLNQKEDEVITLMELWDRETNQSRKLNEEIINKGYRFKLVYGTYNEFIEGLNKVDLFLVTKEK